MTIISLIGPGNIKFHYQELLKISEQELKKEIQEIGKALSRTNCEIEFLPDKGISLEIAKEYKLNNGRKVTGTLPLSDTQVGVDHLKGILESKTNNKKIFDKIQDGGTWSELNARKGLFGDAILYLGKSFGANMELNSSCYIYKWHYQNKKYPLKSLNQNIKAGEKYPLKILIYAPFIKGGKLSFETENYLKKEHIDFVYISSAKELREILRKLPK